MAYHFILYLFLPTQPLDHHRKACCLRIFTPHNTASYLSVMTSLHQLLVYVLYSEVYNLIYCIDDKTIKLRFKAIHFQ